MIIHHHHLSSGSYIYLDYKFGGTKVGPTTYNYIYIISFDMISLPLPPPFHSSTYIHTIQQQQQQIQVVKVTKPCMCDMYGHEQYYMHGGQVP